MSPSEQATYLTYFRADSIVRDAELIRAELGVSQWSVLGQSFGGFCTLAYLCIAPDSLREALFTGGLPPVGRPLDDVYRATFATMLERNRRYYLRYPEDRDRVLAVCDLADAGRLVLPGGDLLTSNRFRQVGNVIGMSDGAEHLHYLLELDPSSAAFGYDLVSALPFSGRNPIYALLNESSYADGYATRWSSLRVRPAEYETDRSLLTGEHVFPWSFADDSALAPLAPVADLIAAHEWPRLYDAALLRDCTVPCAAAIYAEDAYVDRAFSEETAALIPTMRPWLTNEYEHNGLRASGGKVLDRLITLVRGRG
jgi:pimeloyl-ACP methyl ester carboxylesterase